jgi:multidrug resistance efflux pump
MNKPTVTQLRRHEAQVAELTKIVDQLRAVAERHHVSIAALEKSLCRMVRQAERDQDLNDGLFDVSPRDRVGLKKLDTHGRGRP